MINQRVGKREYPVGIGLAVIHVGALGIFVPALFSWQALVTAIVLYYVTGMVGITLGFHRLLTHRSLAVPRAIEYFLALCGTLALQGGPIDWVATHRAHHAHTDEELDPHDSHKGMGWAHVEWLFRTNASRIPAEERPRWAADLLRDPVYRFMEANAFWIQVSAGFALLGLGYLALGTLAGAIGFVVWGIFARLVFTYHCTWLVNSASHAVGYQTYRTGDRSTNNWWVALMTFGEGWHNNHHAFPSSARHGLKWFEFDLTWTIIRGMQLVKLARNVKLPTKAQLERLELPAPPRRVHSS